MGGRYRLTRGPLRGGMSEVWLARDQRLPRDVVLKRLLAADGTAPSDVLEAEARALARFGHPHVVTLHDVLTLPAPGRLRVGRGRRTRRTWLVMEYVCGGSLEDRPPLPPRRAARVGAQIADALAALHAQGLVHGDVKPGNLVVTPEGLAKLADFGAAHRVGGAATLTPRRPAGYTPDYAAPEVVRGRPERASDVFSLAATLHHLVTGRPPRPGAIGADADPYVLARRAARGEVELAPGLGVLSELLPAMLARDPADRPTAAQALRLLREVAGPQDPLPAPTRMPTPAPSAEDAAVPAPPPAGIGRFRGLLIGAGSAAVLGAVVVLAVRILLGGQGPAVPPGGTPTRAADAGSGWGNHRTADPCALVEPSVLGRFGRAELDPAYGNFDRCDVLVDTGGGDPVDVEILFENGGGSELSVPRRTVHGIGVVDESHDGGSCVKDLLPATDPDARVVVRAKREGQQSDAKGLLCTMAETATDHALEVLGRGTLARRTPLPAASLIHQDACALLTPGALQSVPGIDAGHPDSSFGNWGCRWRSTTGPLWVDLRFDRGQPLDASDGTLARVGGRPAVVEPDADGDHTCRVGVTHRPFTNRDGDAAVETLDLTVGGDRSAAALRRLATRLATAAVAQLRQDQGQME
ncbi:Serine/threonine protein kinase [Streptomyces yunnanensis]|uniref:non-specific serine/threonine protein kinase n=2 Tax=Streptomyces yunnanensis TaxID=156453 RepID=A0A9X8QZF3_9ACTN|nr:Serine/threonine protein kinase [Streptomyces yunnanensis]